MQPKTKRFFTAVAASLMSFSNVTPVMAETDDILLNGDILINDDTGTDVVHVEKEGAFNVSLRFSASNIAEQYLEEWEKQNSDGSMDGEKTGAGSIRIAVAFPLDPNYIDSSAMTVKKDDAELPASSYTVENGILTITDSIPVSLEGKTKEEVSALLEEIGASVPGYQLCDLKLTEEGKKVEQMTLVCNATMNVSTTYSYDWEGHVDTEEEANALLDTMSNGSMMESFDGPGYDVSGVRNTRVDVSANAEQIPDGAFNGDVENISAALTALDESDYIKSVDVVFKDVDADTDLSAYTRNFSVDTREGLEINLKDTVDELTALGYVVGEYPTELSGKAESVDVKVRHDIKEEKKTLDLVTITRNIIYECEGKQIGSATQSVTASPVQTDKYDAVTKEVISSTTSDDDITLEEVECAAIEGYTPTQRTIPAETKKLSEWQSENPVTVKVEYTKTVNETEKEVEIVFVDENEDAPQDLSSYNKTITVAGIETPDGTFIANEPVPTGIEDGVKELVDKGYKLSGTAPSTVDGSVERIEVKFTHNLKKSLASSEKSIGRTIILHMPEREDEIIVQDGKLIQETTQLVDAVTGDIADESSKFTAHIDEYEAPEIGGFTPDIKVVPTFDTTTEVDPPNEPSTVEITYAVKEEHTWHEFVGAEVEVILEDETPVDGLGGYVLYEDDPDAMDKVNAFESEKKQEILDSVYEIVDERMFAKSYLNEKGTGMVMVHTYIVRKLDTAVDYVFDIKFEHDTDDLSEYNRTISKAYKEDPGANIAEADLNKALEDVMNELKNKGYTLEESILMPASDSTDKRHHIEAEFRMTGDKTAVEHTVTVNFKDTTDTPIDLSDCSLSFTLKSSDKPAGFDSAIEDAVYALISRGFYVVDSSELDKLTFAEDETATIHIGHLIQTDEEVTKFNENDKDERFVRVINLHFDDGREDKHFNQYGSGSVRKTIKTDMATGNQEEYEELMDLKFNKIKVYDIESAGGYIGDLMEISEETYTGPLPMDTEIRSADVTFIRKNVSKHNVFFVAGPQLLNDYTLTFELIDGVRPSDYEDRIKATVDELTEKGYIVKPYDLSLFSPQDRIIELDYNIEKKELTEETDITRTIRVSAPSGSNIPAETIQNGKLIRTYYHVINHTTGEEWDVEGTRKAVFPEFVLKEIDGYVIDGNIKSEIMIAPDAEIGSFDVSVTYNKKADAKPADSSSDSKDANAKSGNTSVKSAKEGNAKTGTGAPIIPIVAGTAGVLLIGLLVFLKLRNKQK